MTLCLGGVFWCLLLRRMKRRNTVLRRILRRKIWVEFGLTELRLTAESRPKKEFSILTNNISRPMHDLIKFLDADSRPKPCQNKSDVLGDRGGSPHSGLMNSRKPKVKRDFFFFLLE